MTTKKTTKADERHVTSGDSAGLEGTPGEAPPAEHERPLDASDPGDSEVIDATKEAGNLEALEDIPGYAATAGHKPDNMPSPPATEVTSEEMRPDVGFTAGPMFDGSAAPEGA